MAQLHLTVIGAGQMGRSALSILARHLPEARITVIDRSAENLALAKQATSGRIEIIQQDVVSQAPDLDGSALIVNFAGPFFLGSDAVARAALKAGASYADVCDDVEGIQAILDLDSAARSAGVPLITGAGLSPGVANWMASRILAKHEKCDGIKIVWVVSESDPGGLAVLRHMLHMAVAPCPIWRNGVLEYSKGFVPDTAETFDLQEPFGRIVAYDTAHPEPITLPLAFPRLRLAQCKGSLMPAWANQAFSTLGRIGFGHHDLKITIGDHAIEPADFLWRLLWERHRRKAAPKRSAKTMINVIGLEGDRPVVMHTITDDSDMSRGTGLGVAAAAIALLQGGAQPGAGGAERISADLGLKIFQDLCRESGAFAEGIREIPLPVGNAALSRAAESIV